ncbi:hypothetical protein WOLCODRAFT_163197 [Wolfiporia cocos MD-104 SS10]|uniref:Translation initiation factor 3 N-terminal domain-containing protein n=1 Tax=Wolfiporia cocos (strain MD-104) TaxID=742152 RepID=A0A2H3JNS1_WOLCO|nr:hypothetical protein WOLCODRAFT_163197 [Wolfiporia cocos MD-104 SS10]
MSRALLSGSTKALLRNWTNATPSGSRSAAAFHSTARAHETKVTTKPRNHDIPFRVVRLVNPETRHLDPPASLSEVIARCEPKKEYVELVASEPEPIVKIIKSSEVFSKKMALKERQKGKGVREEKEVQMTWGISAGDLAHKMKRVRQELEKGNRVNLVYTRKKGQVQLSPQAMEERLKATVQSLEDVGKEWKSREGAGSAIILFLQGLNDPVPKGTKKEQEKESHDTES